MATVDHLPDELLSMIMEYLPAPVIYATASRVCRRWARVCAGRVILVREIDAVWYLHGSCKRARAMIILAKDPLLPSTLPFMTCSFLITELTIHLGLPLSSREIMLLARLRLRHVDVFCRAEVIGQASVAVASKVNSFVANDPIAAGFLRTIAGQAQLKALHMYGRAGSYPREELTELINSHSSRFEDLTLRCPTLVEADYAAIGKCTSLYSLKLYSCWEMTLEAALHITNLQGLRVLHLTGTRRYLDAGALRRVLAQLPGSLRELSLSASRLGDEHVGALAARVPRLAALELWRTQLSPRALVALAARLPLLQELDVDLPLPRRLLQLLERHHSLNVVRCRLPPEKLVSPLCLSEAAAAHGARVRRGEADGPRAQGFYYWTRHVPPHPAGPY
ncbi:uncharacterized protein [Epargyreus clarus]|uniref:uncharacterized protein isoform X1 n=1 Tax=Epargyreus clarus TaxID=520877 RepID=UPI003C2D1B9C